MTHPIRQDPDDYEYLKGYIEGQTEEITYLITQRKQLITALNSIREAHKFNTAAMLPCEVYKKCDAAISLTEQQPTTEQPPKARSRFARQLDHADKERIKDFLKSNGMSPASEPDAAAEWRGLALQFDGHRMQALEHLRTLLENPEKHAKAARAFLSSPPLRAEQVLQERIAATATKQPPASKRLGDNDLVLVPRKHVIAACHLAMKADAINLLEGLRKSKFLPAYTAPQPPAVPNEMTGRSSDPFKLAFSDGWNACRDAMLAEHKPAVPDGWREAIQLASEKLMDCCAYDLSEQLQAMLAAVKGGAV